MQEPRPAGAGRGFCVAAGMSEPTSEALVADLLRLLELKPLGEDRFEGPRRRDGVGRVFGGQVIAQALMAAQATVPEDRPAHSLHAYFLRGGSEQHDRRVPRRARLRRRQLRQPARRRAPGGAADPRLLGLVPAPRGRARPPGRRDARSAAARRPRAGGRCARTLSRRNRSARAADRPSPAADRGPLRRTRPGC